MAGQSGMTIDFSRFMHDMDRVDVAMTGKDSQKNAMKRAGQQLLSDAIFELPQAPIYMGTLRASGTLWVDNELVSRSPFSSGQRSAYAQSQENARPVDSLQPDKETVATVAFLEAYAAYQHEGISRFSGKPLRYTKIGAGAKYLEKPLYHNAQKYFEIAMNELRKSVRGR